MWITIPSEGTHAGHWKVAFPDLQCGRAEHSAVPIILCLSFNNTKMCLNKWELGFDGNHKICLKWVAFIYKENWYPRCYLYTLWAYPLLQMWYYSMSEHVFICAFIKELSCGIAMMCWQICFGIRGLLARRTQLLVLQRTCSASMMAFWKNCQNKPNVRHASWKKWKQWFWAKFNPKKIFFFLGHHTYPSFLALWFLCESKEQLILQKQRSTQN